jgi:serine phosphatase RsbU (regulator of sigma subunit)
MAFELQIRASDGAGQTIPLDRDRVGLGRSSANDLCYPDDAGLSRQHLEFIRTGPDWFVRDLGSKNGTLINGNRIAAATKLRIGDRVTAGHLTITFTEPGASQQTVVFFEGDGAENSGSSTVITSLEGLIGVPGAKTPTSGEVFAKASALQMQALIRAGRELAGHRPLEELFDVILNLSVEAVGAARGVLMTLENSDLIPRAARGEGFRISNKVRDKVLKEKASLLVKDAMAEADFKEQLSIVEQRVRSMLAVPLQTSEKVIGLIYLDAPNLLREFTKEDLNLLTVMANVAAIRIEHARLAEVEVQEKFLAKELEQAAEIQQGLLPAAPPEVPGLDLAGYNIPCRTVGGDYFDYIKLEDGRVVLIVADVAGKGLPAAMMMSSLQARVQVLVEDVAGAAPFTTRLNRAISAHCPANRFITFFVGILNPTTGELVYCNAGHNPPLIIRTDGPTERLEGGGLILGILGIAKYQEKTVHLRPGDVVALFSDGVTEAVRPDADEEFGEDRLAAILETERGVSARQLIEVVKRKHAEYTAGAPQADDITLVIARFQP